MRATREIGVRQFILLLDFAWFERMKQFFEEEAKYNKLTKNIEYLSEDYDIDRKGNTIKLEPSQKIKDFKEYCYSSYYPGHTIIEWEKLRLLPHSVFIDGALIVEDLIPSGIIGFFGEFKNVNDDVDEIVGVHMYEPLYQFIKKVVTIAENETKVLKATDTSEQKNYSEILDFIFGKLKEYFYDKYSRLINAYAFINEDTFMDDICENVMPSFKDNISTNVQEFIECFKGKWNGVTILNETDYKIVLASTIVFVKEAKIPAIQNKIYFAQAPKEFIKKTFHLLSKKASIDPMLCCTFLFELFEPFSIGTVKSLYSNFARYGDKKYQADKETILM
jgi:hypothetical protein